MYKPILLGICFFLLSNVFGQQPTGTNDSVPVIMTRVKEMLLKHSHQKLPVRNRQPLKKAQFQPIKFDGCDLSCRWVAPLDKLKRRSLVVEMQLNIGDLNSSDMLVLTDFYHPDRWDVHLSTGKVSKIRMQRIILTGAKVTSKETFSSSQGGFTVDSEAVGQQISDQLKMAIPQCVSDK